MNDTKLIVVDVNFITSYRINQLLNSKEVEVSQATTFSETINKLKTQLNFDIMVIELKLGAEDGFNLIRRAKEIDPNLFVVVLTSLNTRKSFVQALKVGANDYILKPYDEFYLQSKLLKSVESIETSKQMPYSASNIVDQSIFDAVKDALDNNYELIIGLIVIYHKETSHTKSTNIKDAAILKRMIQLCELSCQVFDSLHQLGSNGIVLILPKRDQDEKELISKTFSDTCHRFIDDNKIDDTYIVSDFISLPSEGEADRSALSILAKKVERFL